MHFYISKQCVPSLQHKCRQVLRSKLPNRDYIDFLTIPHRLKEYLCYEEWWSIPSKYLYSKKIFQHCCSEISLKLVTGESYLNVRLGYIFFKMWKSKFIACWMIEHHFVFRWISQAEKKNFFKCKIRFGLGWGALSKKKLFHLEIGYMIGVGLGAKLSTFDL